MLPHQNRGYCDTYVTDITSCASLMCNFCRQTSQRRVFDQVITVLSQVLTILYIQMPCDGFAPCANSRLMSSRLL